MRGYEFYCKFLLVGMFRIFSVRSHVMYAVLYVTHEHEEFEM